MVNHTSTYSNLGYSQLLDPDTVKTDTNTSSVDLQNCDDVTLLFSVGASGDTLSGSLYLELEVEESDDNSTFTDVADADLTNYVDGTNDGTVAKIDAAEEDDVIVAVGYRGNKRYIRGVINVSGTHTNGTPIAVLAVTGRNRVNPQNSET